MQKKKIFFSVVFIIIETLLICFAILSNFKFEENSLLYISSTMAQVVATLYGLTITGYIFFDDKLKIEIDKDDSLIDIIEFLKLDYRKTLFKLGLLIAITIFLSIANIILLNVTNLFDWIAKAVLYNSILGTVICIIFILSFIIKVIDPKKYEKVSKQEKQKIDYNVKRNNDENFIAEFMREFSFLEKTLKTLVQPYYTAQTNTIHDYIHIIKRYQLLNNNIIGEIDNMRRYRNYVVHGVEAFVDEYMYKQLQNINERLKNIINK